MIPGVNWLEHQFADYRARKLFLQDFCTLPIHNLYISIAVSPAVPKMTVFQNTNTYAIFTWLNVMSLIYQWLFSTSHCSQTMLTPLFYNQLWANLLVATNWGAAFNQVNMVAHPRSYSTHQLESPLKKPEAKVFLLAHITSYKYDILLGIK